MREHIPALSEAAKSIRLGKYQHYKGDVMEVVGVSLHSETLEEFVTYKHVTGPRTGEPYYWVRPVSMFLENVGTETYKGPRFLHIEE